MNNVIWLIILFVSIAWNARESNIEYAIGYTVPWFVIGMALSGVWWLVGRKQKNLSWKWFDWLNVAAYIMLALFIVKSGVHNYMGQLKSPSSKPIYQSPAKSSKYSSTWPSIDDTEASFIEWQHGNPETFSKSTGFSPSFGKQIYGDNFIMMTISIKNKSKYPVRKIKYKCSIFDKSGNLITNDIEGEGVTKYNTVFPGLYAPIWPGRTEIWESLITGGIKHDTRKITSIDKCNLTEVEYIISVKSN
jgi:hypothetical protein